VAKAGAETSLTQRELALRLAISTAWVRELTARGVLVRDKGGYPWPRNHELYGEYQSSLPSGNGDGGADPKYEVARARKTEAEAQLRELDLAVRRGELVPMEDVLTRVREPLESVDLQLRTAPRRHAEAWARRLGITQAEAIALIHDLTEDVRADLRGVFSEPTEEDAA
jgi:phage terminase Nu1 subunit (DNA packaging protein)